jgi:hypothetical protein
MWKTDLIDYNNSTYISTGLVDKMWKNNLSVENLDNSIALQYFHRAKMTLTCGNVENFYLSIDITSILKRF